MPSQRGVPRVPGCTPCPRPRCLPGCEGRAGSRCMCPFSYIFALNAQGGSIPQTPPDEPTDPTHQPTGISDAASPLRPPGAKELMKSSLRSKLKSRMAPPCPAAHSPRQPPALPNTSPLRSEGSQEIRSLQGTQCKTQICRSWFLAQVQTTFVPEICFRALFSKPACAEACAKQHWLPPQPAPGSPVPTWGQGGGRGAPQHRPQPR